MNWENLTSKEFAQAVKENGVCIVDFGLSNATAITCPLGQTFKRP